MWVGQGAHAGGVEAVEAAESLDHGGASLERRMQIREASHDFRMFHECCRHFEGLSMRQYGVR